MAHQCKGQIGQKKGIINALPIGNKIAADNQGKVDNPAPKVPVICVAKCVT